MRKVVLGFILGVGLTLSFNVYAAVESLIGKQVQGEVAVKLDGSDLNNKAAIIDGTSYLPVRSIGEALGLNVDFQNDEVILNQPKEVVQQVTATDNTDPVIQTPAVRPLTLKQIEGKIELAKQNIQGLKMSIESGGGTSRYSEYQERIAKYESELGELEKQKAALQNQP